MIGDVVRCNSEDRSGGGTGQKCPKREASEYLMQGVSPSSLLPLLPSSLPIRGMVDDDILEAINAR